MVRSLEDTRQPRKTRIFMATTAATILATTIIGTGIATKGNRLTTAAGSGVWAYRGLGLDAVASSVKKDGDKRGQQADHHGDGHPINVKKERVSHCLCLLCVSTRLCHLAACGGGGAWSVLSCNVKKWSCWP